MHLFMDTIPYGRYSIYYGRYVSSFMPLSVSRGWGGAMNIFHDFTQPPDFPISTLSVSHFVIGGLCVFLKAKEP